MPEELDVLRGETVSEAPRESDVEAAHAWDRDPSSPPETDASDQALSRSACRLLPHALRDSSAVDLYHRVADDGDELIGMADLRNEGCELASRFGQ